MHAPRRFAPAVVATLLLLGLGGCGKRMVPFTGVIHLDGKPVKAGTTIMFAGGDGVRPATGVTDENGSFELSTNQSGDGIMVGEYKVIVLSADNVVPVTRNVATERGTMAFDEYKKAVEEMRSRPPKKGTMPVEYANPQTTPLKWRVPEDGTDNVKIDIQTSDAPVKP